MDRDFDSYREVTAALVEALRQARVFVAASTHPGARDVLERVNSALAKAEGV